MTAVSIPRASGITPPKPTKTGSAPSASNPAFTSELQSAIKERKPGNKDTKQGLSTDSGKAAEKKKDDLAAQAPVVGTPQPTVQPQPAGALGLPSAGTESGATTDSASMQVASDQPPPDTSALIMTLKAPAAPADAVQTNPKTQLAFALRLADVAPNREAQVANSPIKPLPEAIEPDLKTPPAFAPEDPTAQPPVMAVPVMAVPVMTVPVMTVKDTPQPVADTKIDLPVKTIEPATSVIVAAPAREGAAPDSGTHNGGGASDRHTPQQSKETPLQTSAPAAITVAMEQPAPQPSNRPTATTSVDHVAAPLDVARPDIASKVTDVSVTIPVPRADATGDDRIAIRMLQRGAEIHVSVRTPDTQLAQSLRQDLSKLATGLDQGGFRTETWRPAATTSTAQSNSSPQHDPPPGNPNGDAAGPDRRSAGHGGQGEQKRRQQDERPRWVAELEQQQHQ